MDMIIEYLRKWNGTKDAFGKVQGAYAALAIVLFLGAAVVSLMNPNLGQTIIFFSLIAFLVFIGNAVVWALIQTFVVPSLSKPAPRTRKK